MKSFHFLLTFLAMGTIALADSTRLIDIEVIDPWVRAVPPSSTATAAFMVIKNHGKAPAKLVGTSSPTSPDVRPMITTQKKVDGKEVAGMEFVESFEIPAKGKRILEPGGDHIMIMQLKKVPKAGSTVSLLLKFLTPNPVNIEIQAPVR